MSSYVLILKNEKERELEIGKLGKFLFKPGFYYYVGSAKKIGRVKRHFQKKGRRWHIDYISDEFEVVGAILFKIPECDLASRLKLKKIKGFGCSDCKCESHLFYSEILTIENLFT